MKKKDILRFRRIGSCRQPSINNADDMAKTVELDNALWAVNSMPTDAIVADPEFLKFLDTDNNGRIRPNEIRQAIKWMLMILKGHDGINKKSDILHIDSFNSECTEGTMLKASMELILKNMGLANAQEISLAQLRNTASITGAGNSNGDGIVTLENTNDEDCARIISNVMKICGSKTDLSTLQGIDGELLTEYITRATARAEWLKNEEKIELESAYKNKAGDFFKTYIVLEAKLNDFFTLSGAMDKDDEERIAAMFKIDPLNADSLRDFIAKAPVARPVFSRQLDMKNWVNPLDRDTLQKFMQQAFELHAVADANILTENEWRVICNNFLPRKQWANTATDEKFAGMSIEDIEKDLLCDNIAKVKTLIDNDLAVAAEINAVSQLRKLSLYQQNMLDFINNFISLAELFDPSSLSMVQPGELIMGGRHFALNTIVKNPTEHKKIIQRSNICVMYIALETVADKEVKKLNIASAVTSGTMRDIFIGKCGVFYAGDGTEYDAKVTDFVQQPVSFMEALLQPFYSFGSFMSKQADKFFSTRSKDVETALNKQVDNAAKGKGNIVDTKAVQQTPAISGSMLLMGGGVGLAALGSSVAFIANSIQQVPMWKIAAVLFGIIFTISAPMMLVSIVKLQNRRISDFFAAGGWAVNLKIRLSRKMGSLFTRRSKVPFGATLRGDLVDLMRTEIKLKKNK